MPPIRINCEYMANRKKALPHTHLVSILPRFEIKIEPTSNFIQLKTSKVNTFSHICPECAISKLRFFFWVNKLLLFSSASLRERKKTFFPQKTHKMNTNFCMERNLNYDEFFSHSYTSFECAQTGERKRGKNWSKKGLGEKNATKK